MTFIRLSKTSIDDILCVRWLLEGIERRRQKEAESAKPRAPLCWRDLIEIREEAAPMKRPEFLHSFQLSSDFCFRILRLFLKKHFLAPTWAIHELL